MSGTLLVIVFGALTRWTLHYCILDLNLIKTTKHLSQLCCKIVSIVSWLKLYLLPITGADCLLACEWKSPNKIIALCPPREGTGDILVATTSGGLGTCSVQVTNCQAFGSYLFLHWHCPGSPELSDGEPERPLHPLNTSFVLKTAVQEPPAFCRVKLKFHWLFPIFRKMNVDVE